MTTENLSYQQSTQIDRLIAEGSFDSTEQAVDALLSEVLGEAPQTIKEKQILRLIAACE